MAEGQVMEYIDFPLQDGSVYEVTFEQAKFYEQMFPQLNVAQEFCKMAAWLYSNPGRRKTKRGTARFICNWLLSASARQETPSRVRMEARVGAHHG